MRYPLGVAATPSIKITKSGEFKGQTQYWSNRYHFNGGTPADSTHWGNLADAIKAAEAPCFDGATTFRSWTAYNAGSDVPVASGSLSGTGSGSWSGYTLVPLECAALIRWATAARSTKNHPIYLFSYMHGVARPNSGDSDALLPAQKTAFETYATSWISGFSDGTNTYNRAGPRGASATSRVVNAYITHRDFPR